MNKVLKQLSDLRKSMPRPVQWLALGAAFVVVLILLTLLLWGSKTSDTPDTDAPAATLTLTPDAIDWSDTRVDDKQVQKITVSASAPVRVTGVRLDNDVTDLAAPKTTCTNIGEIDDTISCTIDLQYAPKSAMDPTGTKLLIDWHGADMPDTLTQTAEIPVVVGAVAPAPVAKPTPRPEPEPEPQPDPEPVWEPEPEPDPTFDIRADIQQDIADLTPVLPADDAPRIRERRRDTPRPSDPVDDYTPAPEACSDFAFPGYNNSGTQIGWIKPERGAYYFHPFGDRDCNNPTGVYNPDNGIITAMDNPSQKIGTDAEHIGYTASITTGVIPQLSNPVDTRPVNRARQLSTEELEMVDIPMTPNGGSHAHIVQASNEPDEKYLGSGAGNAVVSSMPYDRSFILRQYKPIPATIVSEIRADTETLHARGLPVRATVDRNVYSDDGRTVIIPTGTLMLGYVTGNMPGPYKAIGRMQVEWYQFIRPDGVEFNFPNGSNPFSGDAQGRVGVPGHGSTDYLEQFVMPMLTAIVPAAVNLIAPISDTFVNQIDLDNNTVVQSGQVRSSELAKNEIITAWNQVAQKLMVDMMDNTVPPFSIAAGTRITVYSPEDLIVTCGAGGGKKCAIAPYGSKTRFTKMHDARPVYEDGTWTGQVRSFNLDGYCDNTQASKVRAGAESEISKAGLDYRTVLFYCQSKQYQAINNAKQEAIYQNQQQTSLTDKETGTKLIYDTQKYNEQVLGLTYNDDNTIQNPFQSMPVDNTPIITCEDGTPPDGNGCCTGEIYTDMGDQGFNCCPETGGDCFPPIL
ncbi:hypothetical protein HDR63_03055 [bacterium]|nr:hypothetical protein [bacterium]